MKSVTQPFSLSLQIQPLNPHRRQTSLHSLSPLSLSSLKTHPKRPFPIKSQQTHLNKTQSTSTQDDGIPIDHVKTLARFKSLHNHITVVQVSRAADHPFAGSRLLLLDSPGNIHSISFTFPNRRLFTSTYFDVFATLPPILPPGPLAVLGFGAGSAAKLILESYPTGVVHGWEIDPAVISVGREFFDLSWLERKFPDRLKSYPLMTDFLKSGLFKWAGDAHKFSQDRPYIELVTSPNNPDGFTRKPVVNQKDGILVHDLAYYWPQYTPINSPADHELMLFTVSKSSGHAGARIGWALVKDQEVARKMTEFIEINTIGVSKDSQLRAAKILQAVADSCDRVGTDPEEVQPFFDHSYMLMEKRWNQLRAAVEKSRLFSLPNFSTARCNFSGRNFETQLAFAWLKCEGEIEDCEIFLRSHHILTRGGEHFGFSQKYVRISMLPRDEMFDLFLERLSEIQS